MGGAGGYGGGRGGLRHLAATLPPHRGSLAARANRRKGRSIFLELANAPEKFSSLPEGREPRGGSGRAMARWSSAMARGGRALPGRLRRAPRAFSPLPEGREARGGSGRAMARWGSATARWGTALPGRFRGAPRDLLFLPERGSRRSRQGSERDGSGIARSVLGYRPTRAISASTPRLFLVTQVG